MTRADDVITLHTWLVEAALSGLPLKELVAGFCERLNELGFDLARAVIATAALDPTIRAHSLTWERDDGAYLASFPHGESSLAWRQGPLAQMARNRIGTMRQRLTDPAMTNEYALFAELKEMGLTDWVAYAHLFQWNVQHIEGGEMGVLSSWATMPEAGFSDTQVDELRPLVRALAAAIKSLTVVESACNVLSAYVGKDAGLRVLRGAITRGSVQNVRAVLMFADLRGFTRYSAEQPIDVTLATLNNSFDCVGDAIEAQGGQILKFMGDGVLAVFMLDEGQPDSVMADLAIDAALDAQARLAASDLPLALDIAIHVGTVHYGNIGTSRRLDFTVIGQAVNEVARLESLCGALGESILVSGELAALTAKNAVRLKSLGSQTLRGLTGKMQGFGLSPSP